MSRTGMDHMVALASGITWHMMPLGNPPND